MSFQEFITKYNGQKGVGNTPENMGECTGIVNLWVENLGLPHLWGHGKDIFALADERYYDKILNTPDAIPQQGDIISWNFGTYGHTAIATGGAGTDIHKFEVFEQNVPIGGACRLHLYNDEYKNVTGWLRPRSTVLDSQTIIFQQSDAFIAVCVKLGTPANRDVVLAELDKLISLQDAVVQKDKQLEEAHNQTLELEKANQEKTTKLQELETQAKNLAEEVAIAVAENKADKETIEQLKKDCQPTPQFTGWRKLLIDFISKL